MRLYERYFTLLRASVTDHTRLELKHVVEANKGIMLSMDGVQPEKDFDGLSAELTHTQEDRLGGTLKQTLDLGETVGFRAVIQCERQNLSPYQILP